MWAQESETLSIFSFLRRLRSKPEEKHKPRACLPTYVTKDRVILSKAAGQLRETREIRLAQQLAKSKRRKLVLAIRPSARIEPSLAAFIKQHGLEVSETQMEDYSVYFGHVKSDGKESDGWVLGNSAALTDLTQSIRSLWLRDRLRIGATFDGDGLHDLEVALFKENSRSQNVDGENVREALRELIAAAKKDGGTLFIQ